MGRTLENKKAIVADLQNLLQDMQLTFVIDYKGLSVAEITDLRNRLREKGGTCKITKNTLMRIAVEEDENWKAIQPLLKETSAFLMAGEDVGGAVKAYKEFQKATKKTELRGGVMEGKILSKSDVEALGDLPSKEELYAQIAGTINAVTTKIALGIKEVPGSLARSIQAIADKDAA
ncbi:MAG: 50S ribosomal protein L10 [Leptolyngbyaceae cyanobacterium]